VISTIKIYYFERERERERERENDGMNRIKANVVSELIKKYRTKITANFQRRNVVSSIPFTFSISYL